MEKILLVALCAITYISTFGQTKTIKASEDTFTIKTSYNGGCWGGVQFDEIFDARGNQLNVSYPCCGQALVIVSVTTDVMPSGRKDLKITTNHGEIFYIKSGIGTWVEKPWDPDPQPIKKSKIVKQKK